MTAIYDAETFLGAVSRIEDNLNEGTYSDSISADNLNNVIRRQIRAGIAWLERQRDIPYMYKEEFIFYDVQAHAASSYLWRSISVVELWENIGDTPYLRWDLVPERSIKQIPVRMRANYDGVNFRGNEGKPRFYVKTIGTAGPASTGSPDGVSFTEASQRTIFRIYPLGISGKSYYLKVKGFARSNINHKITATVDDFYHYFFQQGWGLLEAWVMSALGRYLQDAQISAIWNSAFTMELQQFNQEMDAEEFNDEFSENLQMEYLGENTAYYDPREIPAIDRISDDD